jgi:hypothetical protein
MVGVGLRMGLGLVAAFLAGGALAEQLWRSELRHEHRWS